jgi:hypothetical protein
MLALFRMKAIVGFVGLCLSIAAAGLPACATADASAASGQSDGVSVGDLQLHYLDCRSTVFAGLGAGSAPSDDSERAPRSASPSQGSPATLENTPAEDSKKQPSDERLQSSKPADFNQDIYFTNKLEFSLEGGWHPINIPFPLDVFEGDPYNLYPLRYTLVPVIASIRWHMGDIGGPWILRGNWDLTFSGSYTAIPKGPETRYFSYIMGIRRNFVPPNWRIAPYFDIRLGLGDIDAKGAKVQYAQGQDFTFTAQIGSGVRYNFNPRYAISAGLNYMHISNAGLSGKSHNYGINVYGPMFGIDIQLRRHAK